MMDVLYLYTLAYPSGSAEAFIEPEIEYLSSRFKQIHIFPSRLDEGMRKIPENVTVHQLDSSALPRVSVFSVLGLVGKNVFDRRFIKDLRNQLSIAKNLIGRAKLLRVETERLGAGVHYSYWFDEWATILSQLSRRGCIAGYVSRAHGFDIYPDRRQLGYFPYRSLQFRWANNVYPVSEEGATRLRADRSDSERKKVDCIHLGTEDHGLAVHTTNDRIHLLSCSSIIDLKRVDRIAEIFIKSGEKVDWTHIGAGTAFDIERVVRPRIQGMDKRLNVLGHLSHGEVIRAMKGSNADVFINLSDSEGIPVTIMEATSMGIPIIATDVGGVSEIVTEKTGRLVPSDFKDQEVLDILGSRATAPMFGKGFRVGVRQFWKASFSAEKNYPYFIERLIDPDTAE